MRPMLIGVSVALLLAPAAGRAQIPTYTGPKFETTRLADGVYAFVFDNPTGMAVDGTTVAIINDADVVIIDTQNTAASSREVLAAIRKLTDKPVRYVITTHWHGDHWQGNQIYQEAFPGVEFVAHANTAADIDTEAMPTFDSTRLVVVPRIRDEFETAYASGKRRDGKPYEKADSIFMREQIAVLRWLVPAVKEIRDVRPTMTIADSLVLRRGNRSIVVRFLGRGNTRGDLTVWLPVERIVVTGDLLVNPVPYSFGSYLGEWVKTLGAIHALGATTIVPGHGAIQKDHAYLDQVVSLLEETRKQTRDAVARKLDLDATRKAVDLSAFRQRFAGGDRSKERAFDAYFIQPAVERAWKEARGELDVKTKP